MRNNVYNNINVPVSSNTRVETFFLFPPTQLATFKFRFSSQLLVVIVLLPLHASGRLVISNHAYLHFWTPPFLYKVLFQSYLLVIFEEEVNNLSMKFFFFNFMHGTYCTSGVL